MMDLYRPATSAQGTGGTSLPGRKCSQLITQDRASAVVAVKQDCSSALQAALVLLCLFVVVVDLDSHLPFSAALSGPIRRPFKLPSVLPHPIIRARAIASLTIKVGWSWEWSCHRPDRGDPLRHTPNHCCHNTPNLQL